MRRIRAAWRAFLNPHRCSHTMTYWSEDTGPLTVNVAGRPDDVVRMGKRA